ncbi:PAS domain S-box protein [Methanobacterium oryzae]|uniref:PAS domain S-box protein n=1 Tax=Methanobacterium oryzae TaxID=69540 RepID=UPI003D238B27
MDKLKHEGIKAENKFKEIFLKSPIGILFYNKDGELIELNQSALDITGVIKLEDIDILNLFDNPDVASRKEKLISEGIIKFQSKMDFEKIRKTRSYTPNRLGIAYLDWIISVINSEYLVQVQDISERKQAEEALKESEKKLEAIIQGSPVLTFIIDHNHKVIYWNKAIEEYSGIKAKEVVGTKDHWKALYEKERPTMVDLLVEGDIEGFSKWYSEKYTKSKIVDGAYEVEEYFLTMGILPGKKGRWLHATACTIKDSEDNIIGAMEILQDITERKNAEDKLQKLISTLDFKVQKRTIELNKTNEYLIKEIEERKQVEYKLKEQLNFLQHLMDTIPAPIFHKNTDYIYIGCNRAFEEAIGLSGEKIIGKTQYEIAPKELADKYYEMDSELFENPGTQVYETIVQYSDGTMHDVVFNKATYTDIAGNVIGLIGVITDITERKKVETALKVSEKRYRTLYNDNPSMYFTVDKEFRVLSVNRFGAKELGYNVHELIGQHLSIIYHEEDEEFAEQKLNQTLENPGQVFRWELRKVRKDGSILWIKETAIALKEPDENIVIYTVCEDITDRKNTEKKLKELVDELKRSNNELQQFAYITSHDLQEPLRTIASFTQLLERRYKGQLDSDADEFIGFIVDAAIRMKEMIKGLLDYSRVGTKKTEFKEIDMNIKLNKALSNLKASIDENKAEITYDYLPTILADSGQMIRVFQNLIGNAIKFRKLKEPPKIHVACQINIENNEYIFSVSDNGIGMEKGYTDKIFEVFKRLHTMDKYQGAGIGLSVVKRIIEQHGGRIWVESKLGKGSTFYFTIPLRST